MTHNTRKLIGALIVIAFIAGGVYLYATRPLEEASQDIQENTERLDDTADASDSSAVYRISQDDSQVEFNIDEVLAGRDNTVVGTTNQIAGDIRVDMEDPAESEIGQIRINARTFQTDSSRRDGAIGRFILQSETDEFEFIEFVPTSIDGLPETITVGEPVELSVTGDLTIKGTTREVTFNGQARLESEDRLVGSFQTMVLYPDFALSIPSVPSVSEVADEVTLKIDFVALRVNDEAAGEATEEAASG
jgi:polyisoprenoid-binding protein YceI